MSKKCPVAGITLKFAKMNPNKSSARYAKGIWHITKSTTSLSWKLSGDIVQFFFYDRTIIAFVDIILPESSEVFGAALMSSLHWFPITISYFHTNITMELHSVWS